MSLQTGLTRERSTLLFANCTERKQRVAYFSTRRLWPCAAIYREKLRQYIKRSYLTARNSCCTPADIFMLKTRAISESELLCLFA